MAKSKMYMFVSGFCHRTPEGDAFNNGDIHIRVTQGRNAAYPVDITSMHGNMTLNSSLKIKTISLTRDQVQQLIDSLQHALNNQ